MDIDNKYRGGAFMSIFNKALSLFLVSSISLTNGTFIYATSNVDLEDASNTSHLNQSELTDTQKNSINMLNYMSVLTQKINASSGNQVFLESAYSSLVNDLNPNSVDEQTQSRITNLMDTIEEYRMIDVKRERIEYVYEQNQAQLISQAIPNPLGLLSGIQSTNPLQSIVSVLYMATDSISSYKSASSQADLQYIQDGWELDEEEAATLHNDTKDALDYMLNMVRKYDLPGNYALNQESIEDFVKWSNKSDTKLDSKIEWFKSHSNDFKKFGHYWLELAKDYYNHGDYQKCLDSVEEYEDINPSYLRKDTDYANILPMAILSAKETLKSTEEYKYISYARNCCETIIQNTKDEDWSLRYFVAQTYIDLYSISENNTFLNNAYEIIKDNVNILVDDQKELNNTYLADVKEKKADKDATKREKNEIKKYNKLIKEERKTELPPVSEALYLNCDLLFALADMINISDTDKTAIDNILHESGNNLFLSDSIDSKFWFNKDTEIDSNNIDVTFDGSTITIPSNYVSDQSSISISVTRSKKEAKVIDDWTISKVKRPKNSQTCSEFTATFKSSTAKKYEFKAGDIITIQVSPTSSSDDAIEFQYEASSTKNLFIFDGISFERKTL